MAWSDENRRTTFAARAPREIDEAWRSFPWRWMNPSAVLAQMEPPPPAPGAQPKSFAAETLPWLWLNLRIAMCIAIAVTAPELVMWLLR